MSEHDLIDAEWAWVASQLQDPHSPAAVALRGYLNDRITERLVSVRADERERLAGAARAGLESQEALDVMVELIATVRADERERVHHWSHKCRFCDVTHHYDDYTGERRAHQRTTGMAPSMGWTCVCGRWCDRIEDWHNHLTGTGETQGEP